MGQAESRSQGGIVIRGLRSSEFHLVVEGARSIVSWLLRYPSWDSAGCICWLETSVGKHEHVQPLVNAESD